jgi:hypothetical protein
MKKLISAGVFGMAVILLGPKPFVAAQEAAVKWMTFEEAVQKSKVEKK